jgi:hypothetical protein
LNTRANKGEGLVGPSRAKLKHGPRRVLEQQPSKVRIAKNPDRQ